MLLNGNESKIQASPSNHINSSAARIHNKLFIHNGNVINSVEAVRTPQERFLDDKNENVKKLGRLVSTRKNVSMIFHLRNPNKLDSNQMQPNHYQKLQKSFMCRL